MKDPANVVILAAHLAAIGAKPYHAARYAEEFADIARKLSAIAIRDCNGYHDEAQESRDEARQERLREYAAATLNELRDYTKTATGKIPRAMRRLKLRFGGDPRGHVFAIVGLPGNTWGGDDSGFGL